MGCGLASSSRGKIAFIKESDVMVSKRSKILTALKNHRLIRVRCKMPVIFEESLESEASLI